MDDLKINVETMKSLVDEVEKYDEDLYGELETGYKEILDSINKLNDDEDLSEIDRKYREMRDSL